MGSKKDELKLLLLKITAKIHVELNKFNNEMQTIQIKFKILS
jgi:hypothetical protein